MKVGAVARVQIGCSLAAVSLMTIGTAEVLMHCPPLGERAGLVCGVLGALGLLIWLIGRGAAQRTEPADISLAWLTRPGYWGQLATLSAVLVYSYSTYRHMQTKPPMVVEAKPLPAPAIAPTTPVKFPDLRLQGIVFQGARSSALINGRVRYVGEEISLVQVAAIGADHVDMVMEGQTNVLRLADAQK